MPSRDWIEDYLSRTSVRREAPVAKAPAYLTPRTKAHEYFLSYNHADTAEADHVEVLLRREGRRVWRDEIAISGGDLIDDKIPRGIDKADTFVALWSSRYMQSTDYCMNELGLALEGTRQKKGQESKSPVVPAKRIALICLDETEPPWRLRNRLHLPAQDRAEREAAIQKLVATEAPDSWSDDHDEGTM